MEQNETKQLCIWCSSTRINNSHYYIVRVILLDASGQTKWRSDVFATEKPNELWTSRTQTTCEWMFYPSKTYTPHRTYRTTDNSLINAYENLFSCVQSHSKMLTLSVCSVSAGWCHCCCCFCCQSATRRNAENTNRFFLSVQYSVTHNKLQLLMISSGRHHHRYTRQPEYVATVGVVLLFAIYFPVFQLLRFVGRICVERLTIKCSHFLQNSFKSFVAFVAVLECQKNRAVCSTVQIELHNAYDGWMDVWRPKMELSGTNVEWHVCRIKIPNPKKRKKHNNNNNNIDNNKSNSPSLSFSRTRIREYHLWSMRCGCFIFVFFLFLAFFDSLPFRSAASLRSLFCFAFLRQFAGTRNALAARSNGSTNKV